MVRNETGVTHTNGPEHGPHIWLAVETGTATGSVAVWRDGLAFEQTLGIQGKHSEQLLPAVDYALEMTQTEPRDLSAFVVGAGPGSFTGVRIGASMAKGWAMAQGTPLYAYSSLLAVAAGAGSDGPVCALFDARRNEVYAACYDLSGDVVDELLRPGAWPVQELFAELRRLDLEPVFAGEGAILHQGIIDRLFGRGRVLHEQLGVPRAANLLWLRSRFPSLGRIEHPETWEPQYVRDWKIPEERGRR